MSENEKSVPYIKRLENQREALIQAIRSTEDYLESMDKLHSTAYKYDAGKIADRKRTVMLVSIKHAKETLGGLYAGTN